MLQITERTATGRNHIIRMGYPSDSEEIEKMAFEFHSIFGRATSPEISDNELLETWKENEVEQDLKFANFAFRTLALHVFESQNP